MYIPSSIYLFFALCLDTVHNLVYHLRHRQQVLVLVRLLDNLHTHRLVLPQLGVV